jgi:hypothetical protein
MALTAFQSCSCLRRCLISALKFLCSSVCFVYRTSCICRSVFKPASFTCHVVPNRLVSCCSARGWEEEPFLDSEAEAVT